MAQPVWISGDRKPYPWDNSKPKAKPKAKRRRRKKPGLQTALWSILTLSLTAAALVTQGVMMGLVAGLSAMVSGLSFWLETRDWGTVPPPPRTPPRRPNTPGGSGPRPQRPKGGTGKPRKRVCSARCRASTQPVSTCNCTCLGKTHGVGRVPLPKSGRTGPDTQSWGVD